MAAALLFRGSARTFNKGEVVGYCRDNFIAYHYDTRGPGRARARVLCDVAPCADMFATVGGRPPVRGYVRAHVAVKKESRYVIPSAETAVVVRRRNKLALINE